MFRKLFRAGMARPTHPDAELDEEATPDVDTTDPFLDLEGEGDTLGAQERDDAAEALDVAHIHWRLGSFDRHS